jgi:hypothetical protein
MKGFPPTWCDWVARFMQGGSVGIRVNDDIGHYFQGLKGFRQADPLSPILFNIVVDMLAILIARGWPGLMFSTAFSGWQYLYPSVCRYYLVYGK